MTDVKPQDIRALIELFDSSSWTELHIHLEELEIHLSKNSRTRPSFGGFESARVNAPTSIEVLATPAPPRAADSKAPPVPASKDAGIADQLQVVRAPNLGTFYRAPKPGAPAYVEVGQRVEATTEVCLIEVMKLFTPVRAGVAGIVRKILVTDGALVEFEQPLVMIEPDKP